VRVEIRLARLSTHGIEYADFFFSSILILDLVLDFDGNGFNVDVDEDVEEFDLNLQLESEEKKKNFFTYLNLYSLMMMGL